MTDEPTSGEVERTRALAPLFAFSDAQNELARLFARSRGMHLTDATAIVQIIEAEDRGDPMTPARLGQAIALTSGATSILLNRLEAAGQIERTREHSDRRVVTLHSTQTIQEAADLFYEPLGRQLNDALSEYPRASLEAIQEVVTRLNAILTDYLRAPFVPD